MSEWIGEVVKHTARNRTKFLRVNKIEVEERSIIFPQHSCPVPNDKILIITRWTAWSMTSEWISYWFQFFSLQLISSVLESKWLWLDRRRWNNQENQITYRWSMSSSLNSKEFVIFSMFSQSFQKKCPHIDSKMSLKPFQFTCFQSFLPLLLCSICLSIVLQKFLGNQN